MWQKKRIFQAVVRRHKDRLSRVRRMTAGKKQKERRQRTNRIRAMSRLLDGRRIVVFPYEIWPDGTMTAYDGEFFGLPREDMARSKAADWGDDETELLAYGIVPNKKASINMAAHERAVRRFFGLPEHLDFSDMYRKCFNISTTDEYTPAPVHMLVEIDRDGVALMRRALDVLSGFSDSRASMSLEMDVASVGECSTHHKKPESFKEDADWVYDKTEVVVSFDGTAHVKITTANITWSSGAFPVSDAEKTIGN
mgnify:CR=1 FL=1